MPSYESLLGPRQVPQTSASPSAGAGSRVASSARAVYGNTAADGNMPKSPAAHSRCPQHGTLPCQNGRPRSLHANAALLLSPAADMTRASYLELHGSTARSSVCSAVCADSRAACQLKSPQCRRCRRRRQQQHMAVLCSPQRCPQLSVLRRERGQPRGLPAGGVGAGATAARQSGLLAGQHRLRIHEESTTSFESHETWNPAASVPADLMSHACRCGQESREAAAVGPQMSTSPKPYQIGIPSPAGAARGRRGRSRPAARHSPAAAGRCRHRAPPPRPAAPCAPAGFNDIATKP